MKTHSILAFFVALAWAHFVNALVFFAKINDTLVPLSRQTFENLKLEHSMLTHGDTAAKPVEFFAQDGYVIVKHTSPKNYVGFYADTLAFGPHIPMTKIRLDSQRKVLNHGFYSCQNPFNTARVISYVNANRSCFQVEIYLLPYDKQTGTAVTMPSK